MSAARVELSVVRKAQAPYTRAWLAKAVEAALTAAGKRGKHRVTLAIVRDAEMKKMNTAYRGKNATTDVLSFPSEEEDYLGDILIAPAQIRRQAKEFGRTNKSEFALMLIHGTLHLLGHDHEKTKEAARMFLLQEKALKKLGLL